MARGTNKGLIAARAEYRGLLSRVPIESAYHLWVLMQVGGLTVIRLDVLQALSKPAQGSAEQRDSVRTNTLRTQYGAYAVVSGR